MSPNDTLAEVDVFGGYRLDGTYIFGPAGMRCVLAVLIARSLLLISASSPEGERRRRVVYRGREAELRLADEADDEPTVSSGYGLYGRPRKPANSGRKRKAA